MISDIPVIINSRNRVSCLAKLVDWLEEVGQKRIIIYDQCSTYPPLLKWYDENFHRLKAIIHLQKNTGSRGFWNEINKEALMSPFIYTDPDVVPTEYCPKDAIEFMHHLLFERKELQHKEKVGLALKIDDIPRHYSQHEIVKAWEKQYWEKELVEVNGVTIYDAELDTTFALYRGGRLDPTYSAARIGEPYVARHLGWYVNSESPTEEELYYEQTFETTHNWGINKCYFQPAIKAWERERNA